MPESMTYDSLVQDVEDYAERHDSTFLNQIPRFIMMAENRIASECRGLGFVKFATGNLTQGDPKLAKPARWRETASLTITVSNQRVFLKERAYTYCRAYWPNEALTDVPVYYADYGYEHLLLAPTPNSAYALELSYHERPEPLSAANQVSWTTQYAPQLLLFGALLEAQPFLKRPERVAEFQTLFDRAKAAVEQESAFRMNGDQALGRTGVQ